jgi:hypothetical protein
MSQTLYTAQIRVLEDADFWKLNDDLKADRRVTSTHADHDERLIHAGIHAEGPAEAEDNYKRLITDFMSKIAKATLNPH